MKVLLVDDNKDVAQVTAEYLGLWNYDVHVVHNGLDVLDKVREISPAAILLDIGLPGMNGYQVAAQLRDERIDATLIAFTASDVVELTNFDFCITKPINSKVLLSMLDVAAHKRTPLPNDV